MCFNNISEKTKIMAVSDALAGETISAVARKYGINRTSVYRWMEIAQGAIRKSLRNKKRGPKGNGDDRLKKKIASLEKSLRKKDKETKLLRNQQDKSKVCDPRPESCSNCGCEKLYKNGTFSLSLKKIIPSQQYYHKKIPVQRFICPACQTTTHLENPRILYHWLINQKKSPT